MKFVKRQLCTRMTKAHGMGLRLRSRRGSALVIILSAVVLVSILVILFISQATLNRQISFSSAGQYRAEAVGVTAMDTIVGDLRSEIIAGSTETTVNGISIYRPTNNFTVVPQRVADADYANVVKRSASLQPSWTGTNYLAAPMAVTRSAASNSSTNLSANGRFIKAERWNAPYLLGSTLPAGFVSPDWILITRHGAITNGGNMPSMADLANAAPANQNYVIGRFAYMIYDEGGLLDINVAGHPTAVPEIFKSKRGLLPQIDLGKIPGITDADSIVQWRNANTLLAYADNVLSNTNGFTEVASGDRTFLSRQDLIRYVKQHPSEIDPAALQYLATFTRELNAPSTTPNPKSVMAGFPAAGQEKAINPSLIDTRVTREFTRPDGTPALTGEPLIKSRFPLSRLSAFTRTARWDKTSPNYAFFGLTRNTISEKWLYRDGADRILTLAEVADEGREPDFLELLQAGIGIGSLGMAGGNWSSDTSALDKDYGLQIAQIAANLIDQYDADAWVTQISFGANTVSGIENLPYLVRIIEQPYRASRDGSGVSPTLEDFSDDIGMWYRPEIWNPHAYSQSSAANSSGPTEFRYWVEGEVCLALFATQTDEPTEGAGDYVPKGKSAPPTNLTSGPGITFGNSSIFNNPTLLDSAPNLAATGNDRMTDGSKSFVGIFVGKVPARDSRIFTTNKAGFFRRALAQPTTFLNHNLQYKQNGVWVTYDTIRRYTEGAATVDNRYTDYTTPNEVAAQWQSISSGSPFNLRSDPRTDRFGVAVNGNTPYAYGNTVRPSGHPGTFLHGLLYKPAVGWTYGGPSGDEMYPGLLSENKPESTTHYSDPDGTIRRGDSAYADTSVSTGGLPLAQDPEFSKTKSRPLILNRPFRSVAEMGYASRGMPWKHLDFFTAESADTALLDLFCINPPPPSALRAGVIDLNTRQPAVLSAALSGSIRREEPGGSPGEIADTTGSTLSDSDASTLATSLVGLTSSADSAYGPLRTRGDLVTRWLGDTTIVPVGMGTTKLDDHIKRRREAPIRVLADVGSTRTWNLLIDVVAQSGRYTTTSANLNQFVVEGERRYWWHIALDRYTGKIVDQHLETVFE